MKQTNIHPYVKSRIHRIYKSMKARCYGSKKCPYYKNYGGRGIQVCDEWLNDEMSFIEWAFTHGYKDNLTIDRIEVLRSNTTFIYQRAVEKLLKEQDGNSKK